MDSLDTKKLVAFLLALKNLEVALSEDDKKWLENAGDRLKLALQETDTDWNEIEDILMSTIESNPSLNDLYQEFLAIISNEDEIIELIPEWAELERELPNDTKDELVELGFFPDDTQPESKNDEIRNVVVFVLANEQPIQTTQNLSFLERIQRLFNPPKQGD
ncbi:MAG: hypothetical protein AAF915_10880 [Cyanobacteria bacterium P01_D01_bin.50]